MRNRASARYQIQMDELNQTDLGDDEDLDGWVRRNLSEAFVRRDRRRLIGVPEASRDAFFGQLQAWAGVGGRQPTFTVEEVLDVREDRLVLCLLSIGPPSGPRSEQLQVLVYDRAAECIDGMLSFDPDDLAGARAELDRVHVGIEGDGM